MLQNKTMIWALLMFTFKASQKQHGQAKILEVFLGQSFINMSQKRKYKSRKSHEKENTDVEATCG